MHHSRPNESLPGERLFKDDTGKLWCAGRRRASQREDALVFTCLSDARQTPRAVAADRNLELDDVREEFLQALLNGAPRLGRLI